MVTDRMLAARLYIIAYAYMVRMTESDEEDGTSLGDGELPYQIADFEMLRRSIQRAPCLSDDDISAIGLAFVQARAVRISATDAIVNFEEWSNADEDGELAWWPLYISALDGDAGNFFEMLTDSIELKLCGTRDLAHILREVLRYESTLLLDISHAQERIENILNRRSV